MNIGINYSDGISSDKRSDLFFIYKEYMKKNVILYFEYPELKNKHMSHLLLKQYIKQNSIKTIELWKWKQSKFYYEIKKLKKNKNPIDNWLYFENLKLVRRLNFWQNFFLDNNIKIHLDSSEYGNTNIIKQIAIENINGLSIGKLRSYPSDLKGIFYHYYPNDIFFTWGEDSKSKLENTKNNIKNILISGYPYNINSNDHNINISSKFDKDVKFKILLIDNNHGENFSISQNIYSKDLEKFYYNIFNLCELNEKVGLIIKPKRFNEFKKLKNIETLLNKLLTKKKCIIIEDAYQRQTINYSLISNLSVGIGNFTSSAFLESIIYNKGVFYDYGNIYLGDKNYDKYLNQLVFNDLNQLISKIKKNIENNFVDENFGNWNQYIYNIEKFRDKLGHERIGEYIFNLKKKLDTSFSPKKSISEANREYFKKWY